jgi:hypothetical protein
VSKASLYWFSQSHNDLVRSSKRVSQESLLLLAPLFPRRNMASKRMRTEPEEGESCLGASGCTHENAKEEGASKGGGGGGGEASKVGEGEGGGDKLFEMRKHNLSGYNGLFPEGEFGDILERTGLGCFLGEVTVPVETTITNTASNQTYRVQCRVSWCRDRPEINVGMPHRQDGPPPGEYTSEKLLGPSFVFSGDMVTKFLAELAKAKIDTAERIRISKLYFEMLSEAVHKVPLNNAPHIFNVLAAVPWLNVGLDKAVQDSLVGLVQDVLRKVMLRVTHWVREQFVVDFKTHVIPREFDQARMLAKESEFRTELLKQASGK